jgi:DMSO reductase family type II enzyme chaperone
MALAPMTPDLVRVFAFAFGSPSQERYDLLTKFGKFRDYAEYEALYIALFDVGSPEPPVPLLESAHHKAVPAQQIALECMDYYEIVGLKADTSRYAPDHLVTQLEFLAAIRYLRSQQPEDDNLFRLEQDFTKRHLLSWLPSAAKKLKKERVAVFGGLLDELAVFLRATTPASQQKPSLAI